MESMLAMEWKEEPLSPIFADELTLVPSGGDDDAPLYWTDPEQCDDQKNSLQYAQILVDNAPVIAHNIKVDIDAALFENLEELKDLSEWIKEESNFSWPGDHPHLGYTVIDAKLIPQTTTETLLQEFENVLESVNPGALTPPQSPPYEQQQQQQPQQQQQTVTLTTLEPISVDQIYQTYTIPSQKLEQSDIISDYPKTPQTLADELAVVEELVRSRANAILCEPPSPSTSNSGSNDDSSSSEDPEWMPEELTGSETAEKTRRRYKPYKVSPVDKKNRKKEQNKNAATRYRLKKKAEVEEILNEEKQVLKENEELTGKISDLQREIRYLKGLMRDLLKAKGVL